MTTESSEHPQQAFSDIHADELLEIKKRREKQWYDRTEIDPTQPDLVGLALSGGGIRSATFCLGFLQELHRLRLLRIFDYLSTVSGGGYLGGWLSAWLSRRQEDTSKPPAFEQEDIHDPVGLLRRTGESADPVARDLREHLRETTTGQKLLSAVQRPNLRQLTPLLYEPLLEQLNAYIHKGATPEEMWERKRRLVNTFPCELRDIFPPLEEIEPERERNADRSQKESEGSRCAWKDPIHHLRLFANYLTPRKGILSADTWRAISVVSRNLILTWLILLPLLGGVMLLGQAYFFLNPLTAEAFQCPTAACITWEKQQSILLVLFAPIAVLLVSSAVMAIAWLLCNRDNSSALDWIIQWACLIALGALLIAAVFAIPVFHDGFVSFFRLPESLRYLLPGTGPGPELVKHVWGLRIAVAWLLILLIGVVIIWRWGLSDDKFVHGENTPEALYSWKREIRRGRFGRWQAKLLVVTAVVAVVLLLSWISCLFTRDGDVRLGIKIPVALIPILSAVAGSIFTALRSTPVPADDSRAAKSPSWISRFVFAATPPLVVCVLAVVSSVIVHQLLIHLSNPNYSISFLLNVAAILSIALCMGLALYELEGIRWSDLKLRSKPFAVFLGLVVLTVSWAGQALFRHWNTSPDALKFYLPITSVVFAVLITAILFAKIDMRQKLKWGRDRRGFAATLLAAVQRFGVFAILCIALTTVGVVIGLLIYFNGADKRYVDAVSELVSKISGALVLTLLALAGGVILFRVLVNRMKSGRRNQLKLRVLKGRTFARRPEALWLTAAVCLTLPILTVGAGHLGQPEKTVESGKQALLLFPVFVGSMLFAMVGLRSLVLQKGINGGDIPPWYGGILSWLTKRFQRKAREGEQCNDFEARERQRRVYQLLAVAAICLITLLDTVMRGLSPGELEATLVNTPANWKLMVIVFFVSLPLFGVSVCEIPFDKEEYKKFKFQKLPHFMLSQRFLWSLAAVCVGLAAVAGWQLPKWLAHVSHIPLNTGLTPILLPVAAACFLIVLFEFGWGEVDNLRSLLLAGFAYLAVTAIFFLQLSSAGPNWYLVLGLLTAICVWVAALGWMVDPNAVSMHQFYKGRLVRAYLGASNMVRFKLRNKEITDTVEDDDLPLKSLINCDRGGPYHLINTTLNLSAGRDLATAQRSASSFVLSQKYCGSSRTKYCLTDQYMNGQLTLGTAVATSGAAVSPSMGAKKPTSALAMLMTLLNVRLGYWAPTPNRKGWDSSQPRLWPFYLVREFLSQTNDLSDYCYLTDGGHFDNTGLYSLIERGCRFVVLVDCGADPTPPHFEDLGEAIRRCRIDFGTEINLKLDQFFRLDGPTTESCFAVGKIKFSEKHLRTLALAGKGEGPMRDAFKREGIIVYVKPSVVPNATADVRGYASENEFFPQQPTTNQWFGEAQFESYRRLGQTCAHSAFGKFISEGLENRGRLSMKKIQRLFFGLYARAHKV